MPSPFPGMDPYLESSEWESFYSEFVIDVARVLRKSLPDRYVVRAEKRVFVDHGDSFTQFVTDGVVVEEPDGAAEQGVGTAVLAPPVVEVQLNMPEEHRETYLEIRLADTREVVTVLEVLSPANKHRGRGMEEYRGKLDQVFQSNAHFVEIDLLRGGRRCSTTPAHGGYQVLVSRAGTRPRAEAHRWSMRDRLPTVPIPLRSSDGDARLDLQAAFERSYDEGQFGRSIDYEAELDPPLPAEDAEWVAERIRAWRSAAEA